MIDRYLLQYRLEYLTAKPVCLLLVGTEHRILQVRIQPADLYLNVILVCKFVIHEETTVFRYHRLIN